MEKLKYIPTSHPYYCCGANFYSNDAGKEYATWDDFYTAYKDMDSDLNLVFRYDFSINGSRTDNYTYDLDKDNWAEDEIQDGDLSMSVYIMEQRHGKFVPIEIKTIVRKNIPEIEQYLEKCYSKLKEIWIDFN